MGNPVGEIVFSGQLIAALPLALLAGLVSFLSPCVLPLVPGYLGYVSGVSDPEAPHYRRRTVLGALLFVAGFSALFLTVTVLFGTAGAWLIRYRDVVLIVSGIVVILTGLAFIGLVPWLQRTVKPVWTPRVGLAGAPLLGIIFAIGWAPCMGPTLVAVTALALDSQSSGRALLIGLFYCLGLGVPFLVAAWGFAWVGQTMDFVKRHMRLFNIIGGCILIVIGLAMVTGLWGSFLSWLGVIVGGFETPL